jgi:hypothetical protein
VKKARVRSILVAREMSYRRWAMDRGFDPRLVTSVVSRYAGTHKLPRGRLSYRILRDLSEFIGEEIVPGVLKDAA